jgi:hypothetical protein
LLDSQKLIQQQLYQQLQQQFQQQTQHNVQQQLDMQQQLQQQKDSLEVMTKNQIEAGPLVVNTVPTLLMAGPVSAACRGEEQLRQPISIQRGRCFKSIDVGHYARNCPNGGWNTRAQTNGAQTSRPNEAVVIRRITPVTTAYLPTWIVGVSWTPVVKCP